MKAWQSWLEKRPLNLLQSKGLAGDLPHGFDPGEQLHINPIQRLLSLWGRRPFFVRITQEVGFEPVLLCVQFKVASS